MEVVRFLATGSIAAIINLISRFLLDRIIPYQAAVVVAYLIGMVVAFFLFRRVLMSGRSAESPGAMAVRRQIFRFIIVNLVALAQVWVISAMLAEWLFPSLGFAWHPFDVAHVIAVCVPALSSYIGHKYYTFQQR